MNNLILKVEDNERNFFKYDEYVKDNNFIPQIKKTHYIHFISYLSGKEGRRRACYFTFPIKESSFITTEELKKQKYKEKTGYDNPSQNPEIKQKKEITTLKNYGVSNILKSKENKEAGMIEKYGVSNPNFSEEIKTRAENTKLKKYGNKNNFEKIKATNLIRYGATTPIQNKAIKEKAKATTLERYGDEEYFATNIFKEKSEMEIRSRFYKQIVDRVKDVATPLFSEQEYRGNNYYNKYLWKCSICGNEFEDGIDRGTLPVCRVCHPYGTNRSEQEKEITDWLTFTGTRVEHNKKILEGKEIDIYLPEYNIGIEYDGLYYHSEQKLKEREINPRTYHLEKSRIAAKNKIWLIHIFEDEWIYKQEITKSRIRSLLGIYSFKIGARETIIKNIEVNLKNEFLDRTHLQGKDTCSFSYGSFYNDRLVAVMTFTKPKISNGNINKNDGSYELSRFSVEMGYQIVGVADKLLKYFIRERSPHKIYSYSDKRWSKGNLYKKLGFEHKNETPPRYQYIKRNKRFYRYNYRKSILAKKLDTFDPKLTEYENMLNIGIDRIWDCGNDVWVLNV